MRRLAARELRQDQRFAERVERMVR